MLTLEIMQHRWPKGNQHIPGLLEGIAEASEAVFAKYGLTSALVVAHAMAQFSEECGQGLEMIENMNYSAKRLLQVFPKHFTPSMADRWANNPQVIAEIAYGGRMGNAPPPSTDGYIFRGAGLAQVTGRDGYARLQAVLARNGADFDITVNPELMIDPAHALECGVAEWIACGCLPFAEKDDVVKETRALNGGLNGLAERRRQLVLWKAELGV